MASSLARVFARGFHISSRKSALSAFNMPAMSPTMTEGGIASWKKKEGESFSAGDVLLEVETDKATIDVEAQDDGVLAKIIENDGSKGISVGAVIAIIGEQGDDLSTTEEYAKKAIQKAPPQQHPTAAATKAEPSLARNMDDARSTSPEAKELPTGQRIFASPIAKKVALEQGIPLSKIKGTGPSGRIILEDVEKYKPVAVASSQAGQLSSESSNYVDIATSAMRRTIAARLSQSKQEIPHYYLTVNINMEKALKLREVFNSSLSSKDQKLSVNDFIVKAVACALADVPEVNSAWLGEVIRTFKNADISIAVATPSGLITPIIKDAGSKGLATISSETRALAKKAREGKLQPAEYQGGTFTISNLGMYGVEHFTAIINPPQSCILAVGSTQPRFIVDGESYKVIQSMKVTLSSDHRTVDGAVGSKWLAAFKGYLENPLTFML